MSDNREWPDNGEIYSGDLNTHLPKSRCLVRSFLEWSFSSFSVLSHEHLKMGLVFKPSYGYQTKCENIRLHLKSKPFDNHFHHLNISCARLCCCCCYWVKLFERTPTWAFLVAQPLVVTKAERWGWFNNTIILYYNLIYKLTLSFIYKSQYYSMFLVFRCHCSGQIPLCSSRIA